MSKSTSGGESIRQGRSGQRARVVLAVVCAVSVMGATAAFADPPVSRTVDDQKDYPFTDVDPCINSSVTGQMHYHSVFVDRSTATMSDTTMKISVTGEGRNTDPADTREYNVASSSDNRFRSSTANYSFRFETRDHIIQEGHDGPGHPKDDYFYRTLVTFSSSSTKPGINRSTVEPCK